jgi:hypothetical protein
VASNLPTVWKRKARRDMSLRNKLERIAPKQAFVPIHCQNFGEVGIGSSLASVNERKIGFCISCPSLPTDNWSVVVESRIKLSEFALNRWPGVSLSLMPAVVEVVNLSFLPARVICDRRSTGHYRLPEKQKLPHQQRPPRDRVAAATIPPKAFVRPGSPSLDQRLI